jgi:pSer/pThr/pTyr-binding forkhead associated (FHA) protein
VYKLVAVGGKLRGKEYSLEEGENTLGRSMDCSISLPVDGVSKNHLRITVNEDSCFIEDMGSSNGTFLNGQLIKKATAKNTDKIAIPNIIFQLVYVKEKKVIIKKKVAKDQEQEESSLDYMNENPKGLFGKIRYTFKTKIMNVIYSFNEQYEWNVLLGILLFIFIIINIGLTIGPVLQDSRNFLIREVALRGTQYAKEVSRFNAISLQKGSLERINTNFLDNDAQGVESYELFDSDGRIVRPINKLNARVNDSFSVRAKFFYKNYENINKNFIERLNDGQIGIARAILAHNVQTGQQDAVGVIAIKFRPASLTRQASSNSTAYLESLVITSLVGIIFFGMVYYMTRKPLDEMKFQIEEVLRGKRKELESKQVFTEIHPLRTSINSILQRLRELQNEDNGEFAELEEDGSYVRTLNELMQGAGCPAMILNSEKLIEHINLECEDLVGIRESTGQGTSLMDSARDQGFAATVIDLCDKSANAAGANENEYYELTGKNYAIHVSSLIGKDNFAKAFYVTFVLDE